MSAWKRRIISIQTTNRLVFGGSSIRFCFALYWVCYISSFEKCWMGLESLEWPSRIWHHRHLRMIGFCWPYWWPSGTWDLRRKTMGVKGVSSGLQGWCCRKREPPCRVFQDISKLFLFCQKRLYSEMLKCPLGEIFLQLIRLSVDNHLANSELRYSMQCGLETLLMFIQQGVLLPIFLSGWKRATRFRFLVLFPLEISKRREVWLFFWYHPW